VSQARPSSFSIMPAAARSTYKERCALAVQIKRIGVEMFPCTNCEGSLRKCYVAMSSSSARCGECVKRGQKCDVRDLPLHDWAAIEREEKRVSEELARTTAELHQTLARQSRLMKQQQFVRTRAKEMLQRGLSSLDELDDAEREGREKEQEHEREVARLAEPGPSSESLFGDSADAPVLSPTQWAQFLEDVGVSTPGVTHG
jgi:dynactin complex subunit